MTILVAGVSGDTLPTSTFEYDMWGGVATVTETSVKGSTTSTRASTSIDDAGRTTSFDVTSNIPGSVSRPATGRPRDFGQWALLN